MRYTAFFTTVILATSLLIGCSEDSDSGSNNGSSDDAGTGGDMTGGDFGGGDTGTAGDAGADATADMGPPEPISYSELGSLVEDDGEGSFRFGAATAAAQIEDGITNNDWYWWTLPEEQGGQGAGEAFVGDAVMGATNALDDIGLMEDLSLDAYRFSVSWTRIEPQRDQVSEDGLKHYDDFLDGLEGAGIRPMITVHHFSSPIWVHDFREDCTDEDTPTDDNLCGWAHPDGAEEIIDEIAEHAALLAQRYGDRVDEWCTLNEPINYLLAAYGAGMFPPGEDFLFSSFSSFQAVFRNYLRAHVAIYDAITANDTVDADGDGNPADVGFSLSIVDYEPARDGQTSDEPADVAAAERVWYVYHHLYPDALMEGGLDTTLDGQIDEDHPEWKGKLDWLGVQYYFRTGVTAEPAILPVIDATACFGPLDFGACLEVEDETKWVPSMGYEYYEPGIREVLVDLGSRYPDLPMVVTEAGIAAKVGDRRAENVVRTLEQIELAREQGVDVRGYYHWSLMDNFEWAEGWEPKFGLYSVDLDTYERTPTTGATVYSEIASGREVTPEHRQTYGGLGPMTPAAE